MASKPGRDRRVDRCGRHGLLLDVLVGDGDRAVAGEWRLAGGHLVEHHAERVDVAAGIDGIALGLLRGEVGRRTHHRAGLGQVLGGARADGPGDTEVGHLDLAGGVVDQHVAGLDVTVDDPAAGGRSPGRRPRRRRWPRPGRRRSARRWSIDDKRPPVDVLHDDEVGVLALAPVVDGHDVGVGQVGGGLRFPAEPLDEGPVDRQLGEEDLDGDRPVEEEIPGQVHLGHPAPGDVADHLVAVAEDLWEDIWVQSLGGEDTIIGAGVGAMASPVPSTGRPERPSFAAGSPRRLIPAWLR